MSLNNGENMIISSNFKLKAVLITKEKVDIKCFKNHCFKQVFWMQRLRNQIILDSRFLLNVHGIGRKVQDLIR